MPVSTPRFVAGREPDTYGEYPVWDAKYDDVLTTSDSYSRAVRDAVVANLVEERDARGSR
jgi:hypothetical protein